MMEQVNNRNCNSCECCKTNPAIEDDCEEVKDNNCCKDNYNCQCGFYTEESVFPQNPMLAQSYVPIQHINKVFTPCCGLKNGTIFPELVTTYYPGQSMRDIEYLISRNTIGEGCNKCL